MITSKGDIINDRMSVNEILKNDPLFYHRKALTQYEVKWRQNLADKEFMESLIKKAKEKGIEVKDRYILSILKDLIEKL